MNIAKDTERICATVLDEDRDYGTFIVAKNILTEHLLHNNHGLNRLSSLNLLRAVELAGIAFEEKILDRAGVSHGTLSHTPECENSKGSST